MNLREKASEQLLQSGAEMSVEHYEMTQRAEADHVRVDGFNDEAHVLLLTGWISRVKLRLAQLLRPRKRAVHPDW